MTIPKPDYKRLPLLLVLLFALSAGLGLPAPAQAAPDVKTAPQESSFRLSELVPKAAELALRRSDLEDHLADAKDPASAAPHMDDLEKKLDQLDQRMAEIRAAKAPNYDRLVEMRMDLREERKALTRVMLPLSNTLKQLSLWDRQWREEKRKWSQWSVMVKQDYSHLASLQNTYDRATDAIGKSLESITRSMEPVLKADFRGGELLARLHTLELQVDNLIDRVYRQVSMQASPVIFSPEFFAQFGWELQYQFEQGLDAAAMPSAGFFSTNWAAMLLQVILFIALSAWVVRTRGSLTGSPRWVAIGGKPISFSILIIITFLSWTYTSDPSSFGMLLAIALGISLSRVSSGFFAQSWPRKIVYLTVMVLIVTRIMEFISLPLPLMRLFVAPVGAAGAVGFWVLSRRLAGKPNPIWLIWLVRLASIGCLAVGVADASGHPVVALQLLKSLIGTCLFALVVWMFSYCFRGSVDWILNHSALSKYKILREHAPSLMTWTAGLMDIVLCTLLASTLLWVWGGYENPLEAVVGIFSFGVMIGDQKITLGLLWTAFFMLLVSVLASRIVQTIMMEKVFPARRIKHGVALSMSRLIHYAFVLVGIIVASLSLGFTMTKLTILGGAIGVGIGFGLQAIVNNFVSGIILLFENPIKVGDFIEVGEEMAEIKKIGLRATVVRTMNDAEIVVPNSDLVTNKVTNWTLAEKRIRIKIPVGVAYGSDVTQVMQILMQCADDNEQVLRSPTPRALFMGFGDSSLDFQLRVYIHDFTIRRLVQSDLNQAIEKALGQAGIEIPFPQRDIHVRSAEGLAAEGVLVKET